MAKKKIAIEEKTPARPEAPKQMRHVKAKTLAVGSTMPLDDEIELVAYLYSERREFQGGSPEEDWLRAEQEVRQRRQASA